MMDVREFQEKLQELLALAGKQEKISAMKTFYIALGKISFQRNS